MPRRGAFLRGRSRDARARSRWNATCASMLRTPIRAAFPSAVFRATRSSNCCRSRTSARCSTAWRTRDAAFFVAFNFPFDASRCALDYVESRDRFLGGFTFQFFQYRDKDGHLRPHPIVPASRSSTWTVNARSKALPAPSIPTRSIRFPRVSSSPRTSTSFAATCSTPRP